MAMRISPPFPAAFAVIATFVGTEAAVRPRHGRGTWGKVRRMATSPPFPKPDREVLAGLVERVTFHNADNGFCVLKVQARGKRDHVTVVGHAPVIGAGEWITASGAWISDRVHGLQFKAEVLTATGTDRR